MRNIIIWNIGKIFVPLFSPFWTWVHVRSKKFFNKGQGFFVIVRMNKQIYHCILCISLFLRSQNAPYVQIRPNDFGWKGQKKKLWTNPFRYPIGLLMPPNFPLPSTKTCQHTSVLFLSRMATVSGDDSSSNLSNAKF